MKIPEWSTIAAILIRDGITPFDLFALERAFADIKGLSVNLWIGGVCGDIKKALSCKNTEDLLVKIKPFLEDNFQFNNIVNNLNNTYKDMLETYKDLERCNETNLKALIILGEYNECLSCYEKIWHGNWSG